MSDESGVLLVKDVSAKPASWDPCDFTLSKAQLMSEDKTIVMDLSSIVRVRKAEDSLQKHAFCVGDVTLAATSETDLNRWVEAIAANQRVLKQEGDIARLDALSAPELKVKLLKMAHDVGDDAALTKITECVENAPDKVMVTHVASV